MTIVDHPNRPSVAVNRYAGECYAQARAAESAGNCQTAALLRCVGGRLREIAMSAECNYELAVSDLIHAALDVRDGGGWLSSTPAEALDELNRCVNNLRTGRRRGTAA